MEEKINFTEEEMEMFTHMIRIYHNLIEEFRENNYDVYSVNAFYYMCEKLGNKIGFDVNNLY